MAGVAAAVSRLQLPGCPEGPGDPHAQSAAADLEFETAARLRDELKRLKLMDLEFANDLATPAGEAVDTAEPGRLRKAAREEREAAFRKGRR